MQTQAIISLFVAPFLVTDLSAQLQVYVAKTGSNSNSGTAIGSPFLTLSKARDYIRTQQPLANGAVVNIRGGEYFFTSTLQFSGTQDSGNANGPIVYSAYNGEQVIFSGAGVLDKANFEDLSPVIDAAIYNRIIDVPSRSLVKKISLAGVDLGTITRRGWGRIISASSFPEDPLFELYIGGKRQQLARWPNPSVAPQRANDARGSVDLSSVFNIGPKSGDANFATAGGTFNYTTPSTSNPSFPSNRPTLWTNATDIWLSGTLDRSWEWDYIPVASIDTVNKRVTLGQGTDSGITTSESFFHFENLVEEIDEPGEYYVDRSTNTLYLYPPADFNTAAIRYTLLKSNNLITTNAANYLEFHDIILEGSRQGGMDIKSSNFKIKRCEFRALRGTGMQISGDNIAILDSVFHDMGNRGIIVGAWGTASGIGDRTNLTPGNVFIENCEFYKVSQYQANYTPAIHFLNGVSPRVSRCYFHDNPHYSIGGADNNGIIEYSEFTNTPALLPDVGAIYYNTGNNPSVQGTLIRRNYFHDIGTDVDRGKMSAVYMDNTCRGVTIEENIFQRIGRKSSDWAVFNHGAGPGNVTNNVFIDCVNPISHSYALVANTYMKISDFVPNWEAALGAPGAANLLNNEYLLQYPELATLIPADGNYESRKAAPIARISRNLFYNPNVSILATAYSGNTGIEVGTPPASLAGILTLKHNFATTGSDNFAATSNPGFVNLAGGDLSFNPGASVFTSIPGFNDTEFKLGGNNTMGLFRSVGPKSVPAAPVDKTIKWSQGAFFRPNSNTGVAYSQSISSFASDTAAGATRTFKKVSGPDWLSVSSSGTVTGTPSVTNKGLNHFSVRAISSTGQTTDAILRIVSTGDLPPIMFSGDFVAQREAVIDRAYHGSISGEVINTNWNNLITFSGLTGPAWLKLSAEGKITGTPTASNLGLNSWSASMSDGAGGSNVATFTITVVSVPSSIIYVDTVTGLDTSNGSTWALAKKTIGAALTVAIYGSEIRIAQGTYSGILQPPSGVSLFGGFANGDAFSARNPATKPTVHSPGYLKIVAKNDILVDGLTFQGAPSGYAYPVAIDTATALQDTDNIVLKNCRVINNTAQTAILVRGWQSQRVHNVDFIQCEIGNNAATGDYSGNIAVNGLVGEAAFERCRIHSNTVTGNANGPGSGGVDFTGLNALRIENSIFYANTTNTASRAIGVSIRGGKKASIINNTFDGNGSASGVGDALISVGTGSLGVVIANNAIANSPAAGLKTTVTTQTSLQNSFFSGNATAVNGTSTANTAAAINALSWASSNQLGTANFLNSPVRDYRLSPISLMINTGSASIATASDIVFTPRVSPDIGAYEYDATIQDSDGDLMMDSWEVLYGLDALNAADATADLDGDGLNNLGEYIAGTLPNSGSSRWQASVASGAGINEVNIGFNTLVGRTYTLQRSYTLGGAWTNIGTYVGDNTTKQVPVTEAPGQMSSFYRVGVNFQ